MAHHRASATLPPSMNRFAQQLAAHHIDHRADLERETLLTLQLNLGRRCNQACRHCHVDAAPWRTEMMEADTAARIAEWIRDHRPPIVDITGGAPEMNEHFPFLVETARSSGARVIDRCNLTILEEDGFGWVAEFLAANEVEVIASLPCYLEENVRRQRGDGVFTKSIAALRRLNALGYGTGLPLHLVYNPTGPTLPPPQAELEADYKEALARDHGIIFNRLFTMTNQPIARFADDLRRQNRWDEYLDLLAANFNPATVEGLMCRTTLSVGWRGELYDCDFNQMLEMPLGGGGRPLHLWDVTPVDLAGRAIQTGAHCLACTAGCGSSCTGTVTNQLLTF